jgi:glyoxylase-like metal-dependent hydrolase (beta-lactamase superfamily II)
MSGILLPAESVGDWFGGPVRSYARCVLAPNASAWTLDGTNTWILGEGLECVVVDPGPANPEHRAAILAAIDEGGHRPIGVVLTHGHIDHSEDARGLADALGVGVYARDGAYVNARGALVDEFNRDVNGMRLRVIATPGHSSDSVCVVFGDCVLTGDTVLGRGTTLVAYPDGDLGEYLESLQRLRDDCSENAMSAILPGHGPVLDHPLEVIEAYQVHRRERLDQVRAAVAAGAVSAEEVVRVVYADIDPAVIPAALQTVHAQLAYLEVN